MSSEASELSGPDFTQGVAITDLADGVMLLGHANGEAVVMVRRGDTVFAIGATCTHYSGPLAEGVLDGNYVHCPWHHACFDIRTGEAARAPALNPVACWETERRDGRVYVTRRTEREPLAPSPYAPPRRSARPDAVVIVGGGAAGNAAAEMLRRDGYDGRLTVIDDDPDSPYDRPNLSKDYLAGNAPEDWIPLRPKSFAAHHGIDVVRERAASLDIAGKRVVLESGASRSFDRLLLATGASPVRLTTPGADAAGVRYLRTWTDSRAIVAAAENAKRAVVIGSSFIGLEVAASLRARDVEVHVVAPEAIPFEKVLGAELGGFIQRLHEEHGVVFHLGTTATAFAPGKVTLADGSTLAADLIIAGIGVRPNVALAERAGLSLDKGVLVDEFLETSATGIFAAGDIARWPDAHSGDRIRVEHWVVAERQGQVAAHNLLLAREPFRAAPFFWSAHYDVTIAYVGHAAGWDRIDVDGRIQDRDCAVAYRKGNRTLAVATIFRDHESLEAELAMEHADPEALRSLVRGT